MGTDVLARYNGISSPDDIKIGQQIRIPTSTAPAPTPAPSITPGPQSVTNYTVRAGDTLSEIAQKYGVEMDVIIRYNGISSPDGLQVGQTIAIPLNAN